METTERLEKLTSFGNAYSKMVDGLRQFPREMWEFKPSPEDWSIHEIAVHITDSEANGYLRIRKCVAEPGQGVLAYDGNAWAEHLHYQDQAIEETLELFRWLRLRNYKLLKSVPDSAWSNTIEHPENGTMTLVDLLNTYERHVPDHLEQMWVVYQQWVEQEW